MRPEIFKNVRRTAMISLFAGAINLACDTQEQGYETSRLGENIFDVKAYNYAAYNEGIRRLTAACGMVKQEVILFDKGTYGHIIFETPCPPDKTGGV